MIVIRLIAWFMLGTIVLGYLLFVAWVLVTLFLSYQERRK